MGAYRFGDEQTGDGVRVPRRMIGALAVALALALPVVDAHSFVAGGNTTRWAGPFVWALGAGPAFLVAVLGSWRARRVEAVVYVFVAVALLAYVVPWIVLGKMSH